MKRAVKATAIVSLFFAGLFAVLLLVNTIQILSVEPPDNPVLEASRERAVSGSPDGEDAAFYRELRYMARSVFFLKTAQTAVLRVFLIASLGLAFFSLQVFFLLDGKPRFPVIRGLRPSFSNAVVAGLVSLAVLLPVSSLAGSAIADRALESAAGGAGGDAAAGGTDVASSGDEGCVDPSSCPCTEIHKLQASYRSVEEDSEGNWSGFRGAAGTGVDRSADPPLVWNGKTGENILWNVKLPRPGKSSPVVWNGRAYVVGAEGTDEGLTCIEASTGKRLWDFSLSSVPGASLSPLEEGAVRERAASTPAVDAKGAYVLFDDGTLAGIGRDGKLLWSRSFGEPDLPYGYAGSLRAYGGKLFVQFTVRGPSSVLVLDAADGKTLAEIPCEEGPAWASPALVDTGREVVLGLLDGKNVTAASPSDGKVFWSEALLSGEVTASIAYDDGLAYAVAPNYACFGIDLYKGERLWTNEDGAAPDVSSPVAANGLVFCPTSFGVLFVLDGKSGSLLRLEELETGWQASPLVLGDRVFLFDRKGETRIYPLSADKTDPIINFLSSGDGISLDATPAYAEGRLLFRLGTADGDRLVAVGEP